MEKKPHGGKRHGINDNGTAERIAVRFSGAQLKWLRDVAAAENRSIASVIRNLVDSQIFWLSGGGQ
jgi:hypothetical protein